ncbi:hypothetical protein C8Q74DRAFT_1269325 [Fomes fomentarius]|nr:hypothetical protein C8Q74DRAFT_1269325 [Fomes fomentarius]
MASSSWWSSDSQRTHRSTPSPVTAFLVFGAFLSPLAVIPYVLTRRQVSTLRRELRELHDANASLARETRASSTEMSKRNTQESLRVLRLVEMNREVLLKTEAKLEAQRKAIDERKADLESMKSRVEELSTATKKLGQDADASAKELKNMVSTSMANAKQREEAAKKWREHTAKNVEELVRDARSRQQRSAFTDEAKALGRALADVAAFIQEVEMRQGWTPRSNDGRGVEKMRQLAQRLDKLAASMTRQASEPIAKPVAK